MGAPKPTQPIRLFAFGSGWGIPFPTAAPFPLKLATWLRMTGLDHEIVVENNPGKGPKKKSPWIEDGEVRMGDSELIIRYLGEKYGVDPDAVCLRVTARWPSPGDACSRSTITRRSSTSSSSAEAARNVSTSSRARCLRSCGRSLLP